MTTPLDKIKKNVEENSPRGQVPLTTGPLWKGPCEEGPQGGVTQSLLARWLTCRRRAEIRLMDGLCATDTFNVPLQFGNMWHAMEEAWCIRQDVGDAMISLQKYSRELCLRYRLQQDAVTNWMGIARVLYPIYLGFWSQHSDVTDRTPLLQEQTFDVPYPLPSGRKVRLRGKWDSVDLVGKGRQAQVWLQENKTKGRIDEIQLKRNLTFDLQVMLYLTALTTPKPGHSAVGRDVKGWPYGAEVAGVRYNVVKRPAQYQGKKETREGFLERLGSIVEAAPQDFFMRWHVLVLPEDIARFRHECLNPILETLCDDYEWWVYYRAHKLQWWDNSTRQREFPHHCSRCWRHPYGVINYIDENGTSDLDHMLNSGSEAGLERVTTLFRELEV